MASTYTTSWFFVQNGDTTTHNPQDLVATNDPIGILDADIQWEGSSTSSSSTTTDYSTNSNSDTATATTSTSTSTNHNHTSGDSPTTSFPDPPSGTSFIHHDYKVHIENFRDSEYTGDFSYNTIDGGTNTNTYTLAAGEYLTIYDVNGKTTNYVGETRSAQNLDNDIQCHVDLYTTGEETTTNSQTASASYPSVPNGYNFTKHRHREWRGGNREVNNYEYSKNVGHTESITSNDTNTQVEVKMETQGKDETTTTTTYLTDNPSVSGDVSGDAGGARLSDGETSNWYNLSGLDASNEDFNHSIDESNEAYFRFRFDWERLAPSPAHGTVGFYDDSAGMWRECAVADPTDGNLNYDHVRVYHPDTDTWGALDVVATTHDAAITSHQFYDPDAGWLAPREYTSTSA